jgi:magnesium transporter
MGAAELQDEIRSLLAHREREGVAGLSERVGPAEWAAVVPLLSSSEVSALIQWLPDEQVPHLLAELDPHEAAAILRALTVHEAADFLEAMNPDDATDVIDAMPDAIAENMLVHMEPEEARDIRELLTFDEESAGGIMTPAFVAISPDLKVDQAIHALRRVAEEAETLSYIYVLDADEHLLGVLPLHQLVLSRPDRRVGDFMITDPIRVRADASAETAARLLRDRNLLAVPVVDDMDHLLGIVTIDDAADVLEAAIAGDFLQMAGTDAEAMAQRNPVQVARLRLPWLLGTMVIELGAGLVIARFDHVLTEVILLASFMPVISAVSGNVGLQAAAIVVRGLDTGYVQTSRWSKQVSKELATSLIMAVVCGVTLGTVGAIWSQHLPFGLVIGGALTCSMLTAGFMGSVIPMLSKRLGFDPAATAGPFETAFQDVVGFAVFLWLASLLIDYLK